MDVRDDGGVLERPVTVTANPDVAPAPGDHDLVRVSDVIVEPSERWIRTGSKGRRPILSYSFSASIDGAPRTTTDTQSLIIQP